MRSFFWNFGLQRSSRRSDSSDISLVEHGLVSQDGIFGETLRSYRRRSAEAVLTTVSSLHIDTVMQELCTGQEGLTEEEATLRLELVGLNILSTHKPLRWWQLLLSVIPNAFNVVLSLLAVISIATPPPDWETFTILLAMIIISVAVRFWQEWKSNVAAFKLQESVSSNILVRRLRDGRAVDAQVNDKKLVPGDIILLSSGDSVPADCLVVDDGAMQLSQSSLTGESDLITKKRSLSTKTSHSSIFDLENICFMGTGVVSGSAACLVLRTGDDAILAEIAKALKKKRPLNAFQRGTRNVSFMLLAFVTVMVPIVLVISAETTGSWSNAALFSISVAVGLVPEMLPAIVNCNLARGAFSLAKKEAIVKRLDAIQNLGGMSVLCSDKTGTLTEDKISLSDAVDLAGKGDVSVLKLSFINATCQSGNKNAIDEAIIQHVEAHPDVAGEHWGQKVAEFPFDFEKRRSSCIVKTPTGNLLLICKGAFEELALLCTSVGHGDEFSAEIRQKVEDLVNAYNRDGFRVIGLATKRIDAANIDSAEQLHQEFTLVGLVTFLDRPKDDARAAIERLQDLGVDVKVLTGDNLSVALKVSQSLNLINYTDGAGSLAITGPELAQLDDCEFTAAAKRCKVFAKLTPRQKGNVISSLKKSGDNVGMLGDGINDCIALRLADAGISVNSGTAVAKQCADVILTRKELGIVVDCVTIGRLTHGNTIKYIKMVASSNFGNVFSVLIASAWLPYEPMTSLQILVQNLLYDISQIAIPWDHMDQEYLRAPRSWNAKDLLRFVLVLGPTSSVIDMCTFSLDWFYYDIRKAKSPQVPRAHAHWFLQGLLTQTLIVHLLRTAKIPVLQSQASRILISSTVTIMLVGFVIPFVPPFQSALQLARPANSFIGFLAAELLVYCIEVQLVKSFYIRWFKCWI